MAEAIDELNNNLIQQLDFYTELVNLAKRKQKALIEHNLKEIDAVTASEGELMFKLTGIIKECLLLIERTGVFLAKPTEDVTLLKLAEQFPILNPVRIDLGVAITKLQDITNLNTQLIKQATDLIEFTMGIITKQEKNTYIHPSHKDSQSATNLRLLDRSV